MKIINNLINKIGGDKIIHFLVNILGIMILNKWIHNYFLIIFIMLIISSLKEILDDKISFDDLIVDILGILIGVIIISI